MSTTHSADSSRRAGGAPRITAVIGIIIGALMILGGVAAWIGVTTQLAEEKITVADDAAFAQGLPVLDPLTAWAQAEVIQKHTLEATGGLYYAELDREDPLRETAMNSAFLQSSLFTSVVAFGVAAVAWPAARSAVAAAVAACLRAAARAVAGCTVAVASATT